MTLETYTWAEFVAKVLEHLGVDADREGADVLRTAKIRQAVIQLQGLIPQYCDRHENVYLPGDMVYEGQASKGVKPPQSEIRSLHLCRKEVDSTGADTGKFFKTLLTFRPWDQREAMIEGTLAVNGNNGFYSVDPEGYEFLVYPAVYDKYVVSMVWKGRKLEFSDQDATPFDEPLATVVASKVKADIILEVEQNPMLSDAHKREFMSNRRQLWADKRAQTQGAT